MALALGSSNSFINVKDNQGLKHRHDFSSMVSFAQTKPWSCQLHAKNSMHEPTRFSLLQGSENEKREKLHELVAPHSHHGLRVPVFVMLPLDTISSIRGNLNKARAAYASLFKLKNAGVEGVMVDTWWG
ncbi:beta-amylase 3, chloroplastic [Olea europaea subsp. europaea]|uniref:Beta-amylase n=1 Tax=Olea europaea subsp. europaea TaxID=158383 RepID=A0A8S0QKM1_OLEEU|nr:beta-amylase 3, chloroplastic [Olea europaea subsp. europaea]